MMDVERSARCRCFLKRLGTKLADARDSEVRVRRRRSSRRRLITGGVIRTRHVH